MDFSILIIGIIVFVIFLALKGRSTKSDFPYEKLPFLLSKAERNFYGSLNLALGETYTVMCKVRIADVLKTRKGLDNKKRMSAFNQIARKHFDFVLCDPADLSIVAAIELDDASHAAQSRRKRDDFVAGSCDAAGLPLHRFDVKRAYKVEEIRLAVFGPQIETPHKVATLDGDEISV